MLVDVFRFLISMISSCVNFIFSIEIIKNPTITLGEFILGFAVLGLVILFIFKPILKKGDD